MVVEIEDLAGFAYVYTLTELLSPAQGDSLRRYQLESELARNSYFPHSNAMLFSRKESYLRALRADDHPENVVGSIVNTTNKLLPGTRYVASYF